MIGKDISLGEATLHQRFASDVAAVAVPVKIAKGFTMIEADVDTVAGTVWPAPGPVWYLASPYMGYADPALSQERRLDVAFARAAENAALLMRAGVLVYSPIAHGHAVASVPGARAIGEQAWLAHGRAMMPYCRGLIRCELPGWENSKGMGAEEAWFRKLHRPVVRMTPGRVPPDFPVSLIASGLPRPSA